MDWTSSADRCMLKSTEAEGHRSFISVMKMVNISENSCQNWALGLDHHALCFLLDGLEQH